MADASGMSCAIKVLLHTTHGDIEHYGKLTELSEKVGVNFYRTHRAYLINLKYVVSAK